MGDAMKSKAFIFTVIFAVIVLLIVLTTIFLLPGLSKNRLSNDSSYDFNSSAVVKVTVNDLISASDTVISGTVIKADVDADGVLYTMQVTKVYKGRNYSSMGYVYLNGAQTLKIAKTYLFFGITGEEKYHYYEPFENAPWVYEITENGLKKATDSDTVLEQLQWVSLDKIYEICKVQE